MSRQRACEIRMKNSHRQEHQSETQASFMAHERRALQNLVMFFVQMITYGMTRVKLTELRFRGFTIGDFISLIRDNLIKIIKKKKKKKITKKVQSKKYLIKLAFFFNLKKFPFRFSAAKDPK